MSKVFIELPNTWNPTLSEAGEYVDAFIQGSIIGSLKFL